MGKAYSLGGPLAGRGWHARFSSTLYWIPALPSFFFLPWQWWSSSTTIVLTPFTMINTEIISFNCSVICWIKKATILSFSLPISHFYFTLSQFKCINACTSVRFVINLLLLSNRKQSLMLKNYKYNIYFCFLL